MRIQMGERDPGGLADKKATFSETARLTSTSKPPERSGRLLSALGVVRMKDGVPSSDPPDETELRQHSSATFFVSLPS